MIADLIRKSISEYLARLKKPTPWELGEQYFGKYSSGIGHLAEDRKHLLKTKIRAKRT